MNVETLELESKAGSADAEIILGFLYENGLGVDKSAVRAIEHYKAAASRGLVAANYYLGSLIHTGSEDLPRDDETAASFLRIAAGAGHSGAQFLLGSMFRHGTGVPVSDKKAFDLIGQAAMAGYPEAMTQLAIHYMDGIGVAADFGKASNWLRKAASVGQGSAATMLANAYIKGGNVKRNVAEGLTWFQRGAELGDPSACLALIAIYSQGLHGVTPDSARAADYEAKFRALVAKDEFDTR